MIALHIQEEKKIKSNIMGMDLRILPQYSQNADFAHDLIDLHRDSDLFEHVAKLENEQGKEIPRKGIYSFTGKDETFEGSCYGSTIETAYDDVMKGVLAGELKEVLADYKTESWKNKAFIAFLNELPNDLEIWLYWH
jgi:hypothetical protein